jgi:hypothetical protein
VAAAGGLGKLGGNQLPSLFSAVVRVGFLIYWAAVSSGIADRAALVLVDPLSGLPHHTNGRPAHARPLPRRPGDQPYPSAVLPLMSAEPAFRRTGEAFADMR